MIDYTFQQVSIAQKSVKIHRTERMLVLVSYWLTSMAAMVIVAFGTGYRDELVLAAETSFDARDHAGEKATYG